MVIIRLVVTILHNSYRTSFEIRKRRSLVECSKWKHVYLTIACR
jgi:hypothetical protein